MYTSAKAPAFQQHFLFLSFLQSFFLSFHLYYFPSFIYLLIYVFLRQPPYESRASGTFSDSLVLIGLWSVGPKPTRLLPIACTDLTQSWLWLQN